MRIVVCLKHVPRTTGEFQGNGSIINRDAIPGAINPNDRIAIKYALEIRGKSDEIYAITMGPPNAEESLIETLAMGVDKAILLTDKRFADACGYEIAVGVWEVLFDVVRSDSARDSERKVT